MKKKRYETPQTTIISLWENDKLLGNLHSKEADTPSYAREHTNFEDDDNNQTWNTQRNIWEE